MKRLGMLLLFVVVGAVLAGGYWYWKGAPAQPSADGKAAAGKGKGAGKGRGGPLIVKTTRAVVKSMPVIIDAVGTVESEHSVQVKPQVGGVLEAVLFREGDLVKANQLLFRIDARTYKSQYDQALAALARDKAQLENARAQQERLEPLLKREFITRQEYDVAVTSAKSLEATVKSDEAQVEQARIQLEFTRIRAPIDGRTGTLPVKAGNLVSTSSALVTINSMDPILVGFSIPERQLDDVRRYRTDKDMRIDILPDRNGPVAAQGKLVFIDNTVTPQTGTVLLKTRVSNAKEVIWPGQFVNVRIVLTTEPEAIVVPEIAIQPGQEGSFVYLIDAQNRVQVQPVKISRQIGGEVVIASGIKAGDRLITEIPQALQPGATVRVSEAEGSGRGEKGQGKGAGGNGRSAGNDVGRAEASAP